MTLEDWQSEHLATVEAIDGLSLEESQRLVEVMAFAPSNDEYRAELRRLMPRLLAGFELTSHDLTSVIMRVYNLGEAVGLAKAARPASEDQPKSVGLAHPDFADIAWQLEEIARAPDVRSLHAFAQAALLSAITKMADEVSSPDDLRLLADAYLTIPESDDSGIA